MDKAYFGWCAVYSSDFWMGGVTWRIFGYWLLDIRGDVRIFTMKAVWVGRYLYNLKFRVCECNFNSLAISIVQLGFEEFKTRTASNVQVRTLLLKVRDMREFADRKKHMLDSVELWSLPDELRQLESLAFLSLFGTRKPNSIMPQI